MRGTRLLGLGILIIVGLIPVLAASQNASGPSLYGSEPARTRVISDYDLTNILGTISAKDIGISEVKRENTRVKRIGTEVIFDHETRLELVRKEIKDVDSQAAYDRLLEMTRGLMDREMRPVPVSRHLEVFEISSIYANVQKQSYVTKKMILIELPLSFDEIWLVEILPKNMSINLSEINFPAGRPVVLGKEPFVFLWRFEDVNSTVNVTYYINQLLVGDEGTEILAVGMLPPDRITVLGDGKVTGFFGNELPFTHGLHLNPGENGFDFANNLLLFSFLAALIILGAIFLMELEGRGSFRDVKNITRDVEACLRVGIANKRTVEKYIRDCIKQGHSLKDIRKALLKSGWDRKAVTKLLRKYY